jgi:hypothetical protein
MTTLVTLLHVYAFARLGSLPLCNRRVNRRVLIGAGVVLWLIFLLGRGYGGNEHGFLTIALEVVGMHWMGSLFLVAVGLFIAEWFHLNLKGKDNQALEYPLL